MTENTTEMPEPPAPPAGSDGTATGPSWFERHRFVVAMVLVVLGAIIALVSTATVWVRRQALDNAAWNDTSARMLQNDDIRQALSQYLVDRAFEQTSGVRGQIAGALPAPLKPLAAPLAASLQANAVKIVDLALQRPRVQALWQKVSSEAHAQFVNLVEGKKGIVTSDNNQVAIELSPLIAQVRERLGLSASSGGGGPGPRLVVMEGNQLQTARDAVKAIKVFSIVLWLVVLILWGTAIWIAVGRRRTIVLSIGLSMVVLGLIVLLARRIAGQVLVDALAGEGSARSAATAAWFIGTDLLRDVAIAVISYGALAVIGAWLAGPSRWATGLRRVLAPALRARPAVVVGVTAAAFLLLLLILPSGGRRLIGEAVLFALALGGVWALRRQVLREFPGPGDGTAA